MTAPLFSTYAAGTDGLVGTSARVVDARESRAMTLVARERTCGVPESPRIDALLPGGMSAALLPPNSKGASHVFLGHRFLRHRSARRDLRLHWPCSQRRGHREDHLHRRTHS